MPIPTLKPNPTQTERDAYQALMIQEGACNPSGIAHTLYEVCCNTRTHEQIPAKDSPAVRLILHQLVYIVFGADIGLTPAYPTWKEDMDECTRRCSIPKIEEHAA